MSKRSEEDIYETCILATAAVERKGCSMKTLRNAIEGGFVESFLLNGRLWVDVESLTRWTPNNRNGVSCRKLP